MSSVMLNYPFSFSFLLEFDPLTHSAALLHFLISIMISSKAQDTLYLHISGPVNLMQICVYGQRQKRMQTVCKYAIITHVPDSRNEELQ